MSEPNQLDVQAGLRLWLRKLIAGNLLWIGAMFAAAGRRRWPAGLCYVTVNLLSQAAVDGGILLRSPDLLAERSRMGAETKSWDKVLAPAVALTPLILPSVAGFEFRRRGRSPLGATLGVIGHLVSTLGALITGWAMLSNRFFSGTVRIQSERGHEVAKEGPYQFVRHPGYVGMLLYNMGAPLALRSRWAFVPAALAIAATVVRTGLEDETLRRELPGYAAYAEDVPYRLIPGVW